MKRFPASIFVATICVLALAGGSGCRTVWKKKAAAVPPAEASAQMQATAQPPSPEPAKAERKGWFTRKRSAAPPAAAVAEPVELVAPAAPAVATPTARPPTANDQPARALERKGLLARIFSRKATSPPPVPEHKPAATNPPPAMIENPNKAALIYRIQINDQVIISFSGIPQEQRFEVSVDEHGYIKLPLIENIRAEGKTSSELETLIRDSYIQQKIYRRITVNVALPGQLQTFYYFVQGEVRGVGGRLPWVIGMTIMQGVAAAGGPNDFASSRIQVTRAGKTFTISTARPEKDQPLLPGDIIVVPRSFL
ncbi:MAG: polysaccharide biosynthesis/export family protein [Kiritimatiellaeota bacterium]|nr:polysaccharide biosynthesis/export family protein [Kiritimatiellota bacterium]